MNEKHLQFFSCVRLVIGVVRSGICDIQRGKFETIPNSMAEAIHKLEKNSFNTVLNFYSNDEQQIIREYTDWLIENEYAFFCSTEEKKRFPKMNTSFVNINIIQSVIIDIDNPNRFDYIDLLNQLSILKPINIQIRSYEEIDFEFYKALVSTLEESSIETVDIFMKWNNKPINFNDLILNNKRLLRINNIIFHSSFKDDIEDWNEGITKLIHTKQQIRNSDCCGKISSSFFSINIPTYTESQNHNTCLNRKISIDVNGEIKNCPSMQKSYGNIKNTTLEEALNKQGFKDLWDIKKDDIKVCKDCEFRHICTDCRAYIDNPNDIYSKPAKCSYNPYNMMWND